jgi:hypothetical protein
MADDRFLTIYLNDHLAGATVGVELARRAHRQNRGGPFGERLETTKSEIEEDRESLRSVMKRLGAAENPVKTTVAWLAERTGRLKLNGKLLGYSPLSRVEELEALRIGVQGKHALWRALKETRGADARLKEVDLEELADRAERQREVLEAMRLEAAAQAFGTAPAPRTRR